MKFSNIEIRDILISWLVLSIAFTKYFSKTFFDYARIPGMIVVVGTAFVLHELAHKASANHFGYPAEYRMWPTGLLLALASSFLRFIFAAPGAVYITSYEYDPKVQGRISLAGPVANIAVAILFFSLSRFLTLTLFVTVAQINAAIAFFNLLPIGPLDGRKVMAYSTVVWSLLALLALAILFLS
jgi:Zn-dependent protease